MMLALLAAACARGGAAANTERRIGSTRQRNVITRAELFELAGTNAYDAIRTLRPEYLRNPGRMSISRGNNAGDAVQRMPVVYLDQRRFGDVSTLRNISTSSIEEVRYFTPSEAQMQWGVGHLGGAIQIVTGRAKP
jgi:hypothetical protein